MTNQLGDVFGITDVNGNQLVTYTYDEWGKLLSITTAEENNEEQLFVAEKNPLRYRGYYYDNETGMYYLQSRYYDPELCRFISADGFENLDVSNEFGLNTYIYCWNCPIAFEDAEGTTPQLAINLNDIVSLLETIDESINDGNIDLNAIIDKFSQLTDNWINSLKVRYNSFIDKLEYFLNYPDVVISDALSKFFNTDISIRFGIVDFIREYLGISINLSKYKVSVDNENNRANAPLHTATKNNSNSTDSENIVIAIFQGIIFGIELDWINDALKIFGSSLEELAKESFDALEQVCIIFLTTFNTILDYFLNSFELDALVTGENIFLDYADKITNGGKPFINVKGIGNGFGGFISIFEFFLEVDSAGSGIYSKTEDIVMASISLVTNIVSIFLPFGVGLGVSALGDIVPEIVILLKLGLIMPM